MALTMLSSVAVPGSYRTSRLRVRGVHVQLRTPGRSRIASPSGSAASPAGTRRRRRPGMWWTIRVSDCRSMSPARDDISLGSGGPRAVAGRLAPAGTRRSLVLGLCGVVELSGFRERFTGRIEAGARFGGDVLEGLKLLGHDATQVLERRDPERRGLYGEWPEAA